MASGRMSARGVERFPHARTCTLVVRPRWNEVSRPVRTAGETPAHTGFWVMLPHNPPSGMCYSGRRFDRRQLSKTED